MTQDEAINLAVECGFTITHLGESPLLMASGRNVERFAKMLCKKMFQEGFHAGWDESGEGFNSEYGCTAMRVAEMCDEAWETRGEA